MDGANLFHESPDSVRFRSVTTQEIKNKQKHQEFGSDLQQTKNMKKIS